MLYSASLGHLPKGFDFQVDVGRNMGRISRVSTHSEKKTPPQKKKEKKKKQGLVGLDLLAWSSCWVGILPWSILVKLGQPCYVMVSF